MNNQIKEEGLTDAYLLGKYDGYQQGKADILKDIAKIIDDYACDRDVKSNVSFEQMISQYIYEQTKEQK